MSENIEFESHFWLHFRNQNGLQIVQKSIPNLMHNVHAFLVSMFIDVYKFGGPRWAPKGANEGPTNQLVRLKIRPAPPRRPKTAQDPPKTPQDTPKTTPRPPKTPPRHRNSTPKSNGNRNKIMCTTSSTILTFNVVFNARSRPSTT